MHAAPVSVAPEVRLARALKSLSVALTEQRAVLAAWRDALGELKTTTTGLTDSLNRYRSNLGTLGESVSSLNEKAQALQNFANGGAAHDA